MKILDSIDATPSKNIYSSIIADYDINRSISELIDNALDEAIRSKRKKVEIIVDFNTDRNLIQVIDNAGGLSREEMHLVVGPGHSKYTDDMVIGMFGVGSKRAAVAIASDIRVISRKGESNGYYVHYDDDWLETDSWELDLYEYTKTIDEGTTMVELSKLRNRIDEEIEERLKIHLSETYAYFIKKGKLSLIINNNKLEPTFLHKWAYPPGHKPVCISSSIQVGGDNIDVVIETGLFTESSPSGNYGISFYCNDRLIAKHEKSFELGYTKGKIGNPHPNISLANGFVYLNGKPSAMPWNSSKSEINTKHPVYIKIRDVLIEHMMHFSSLSRRLVGTWDSDIKPYKIGEMLDCSNKVSFDKKASASHLPELPKTIYDPVKIIKNLNTDVESEKPWTRGAHESIAIVPKIRKLNILTKNRIALIVLDSALEIMFKDYLVNEVKTAISDSRLQELFKNRTDVHKEIEKYVPGKIDWKKIEYYYRLRCKLVHERTNAEVLDCDIEEFDKIVKSVSGILFGSVF